MTFRVWCRYSYLVDVLDDGHICLLRQEAAPSRAAFILILDLVDNVLCVTSSPLIQEKDWTSPFLVPVQTPTPSSER
jgi:hypothetical protein